jgi:hypothetical protein
MDVLNTYTLETSFQEPPLAASGHTACHLPIALNSSNPKLTLQRRKTYKDVAQWALQKLKSTVKICVKSQEIHQLFIQLLIMYGSSIVFRHYIAIFRERS